MYPIKRSKQLTWVGLGDLKYESDGGLLHTYLHNTGLKLYSKIGILCIL